MTIEQKLKTLCEENGLWKEEADAVVAAYREEVDGDMKRRWNDNVEDYPVQMIAVLWMGTKRCALDYIDKKCPEHFARPMFA
jgi:hypothetical protein